MRKDKNVKEEKKELKRNDTKNLKIKVKLKIKSNSKVKNDD